MPPRGHRAFTDLPSTLHDTLGKAGHRRIHPGDPEGEAVAFVALERPSQSGNDCTLPARFYQQSEVSP